MEYASRNVANTGLGFGIAGTALGLMNNGLGLGGILGGGMNAAQMASAVADVVGATRPTCGENTPVTRYDIQNLKELMAKDQEIAILKSEQNTEVKIADVYERIMTRVNADRREQDQWNCNQNIINATMSSNIASNSGEIARINEILGNVTKTVIPKNAICPPVMSRYNFWQAPTEPEPNE